MKESLKFDCSKIFHFANESEVGALSTQAHEAFKALREGTCPGNDFLGYPGDGGHWHRWFLFGGTGGHRGSFQ